MASTRKRLTSVHEVFLALGGHAGIEEITHADRKAIGNWYAEQQFPARFYEAMTNALRERRYTAPSGLWGQTGNPKFLKNAA